MDCADYRIDCDGDSDGDGNDLLYGVLDEKSVMESDFPERFSHCLINRGLDEPITCYSPIFFQEVTIKVLSLIHKGTQKEAFFFVISTKRVPLKIGCLIPDDRKKEFIHHTYMEMVSQRNS